MPLNINSTKISLNLSSIINIYKNLDLELGSDFGITKINTDEPKLLEDLYEKYYFSYGLIIGLSYNINETNSIILSLKPNFYITSNEHLYFPSSILTRCISLTLGYIYKF